MDEKQQKDEGLNKQAISSILSLANAMLYQAPLYVRWLTFSLALVAVVLVLTVGALIVAGHPGYALSAFLTLVAALVAASWLLYLQLRGIRHAFSGRPAWQRVVPKMVEKSRELRDLGDRVETLRCDACDWLSERGYAGIESHMIRANIFLPRYGSETAAEGHILQLYMEPALRRQMDNPEEWDIRFSPGEGGTGVVYQEGEARLTLMRDFQLNETQRKKIHQDLRWFLNLPLMDIEHHNVLGVLNIDGLTQDIDRHTLEQLKAFMMQRKQPLEAGLSQLPKVSLVLTISELGSAPEASA